MSDVVSFLKVAQERGVVDEPTRKRLETLHGELAASTGAGASGVFAELSQPSYADDADIPGASEAPRFIRGFHDILITIGIVIALGGLWALAGAIAVIPAIIVLAEWFVKRLEQAYGAARAEAILAIHRLEPSMDFTVKSDPPGWAEKFGGIVLEKGISSTDGLGRILDDTQVIT